MSISSRIEETLESWSAKWNERLAGWLIGAASNAANRFLESNEPEAIDLVRSRLTQIRDNPNTPEEMRTLIDKLVAGTQPIPVIILIALAAAMLLPSVFAVFQPLGNLFTQQQEHVFRSFRLDPMSVITAWRRDPEKYNKFFNDLREQGWTDERIEALKLLTLFLPNADEQTLWLAREVFEPKMVEKYGLDDELPEYANTDFSKIGVSPEQMRNKWRAHWEHTSFLQMIELLHRGLLTDSSDVPAEPQTPEEWASRDQEGTKELFEWYRLVEIAPHWRNMLSEALWNIPTRVDVRRWWDMRVISEQELYSIYHRQGYRGKDLEKYVLWTKVYTDFPVIMNLWTKGWINEDGVRERLLGLGMPADRVETMIKEKVGPEKSERTAGERDLTKTDIYKGVKADIITRAQAVELLVDLDFDEDEANYLLEINIPQDIVDSVVEERKVSKADILKGLKAGVLTRDEAQERLMELRYSGANSELILKIYDALVKPPEEPKQREASKADIVLGVKKGVISQEEGYSMLLDLDFTPEAAVFILTVKTEESPFSPVTFEEFKDLTQKWRRAVGKDSKPITEELKTAGHEVARLTADEANLRRQLEDFQAEIIDVDPLPEDLVRRQTELEATLANAERSLALARSKYDDLVTQWRHQEG